jgi:thiol-disulfide isomerase/thioredoxin
MPATKSSASVSATTLLLLVVFVLCLGMLLLSPSAPPSAGGGGDRAPEVLVPKQDVAQKHEAITDLQSGEEARGFLAKPGAKGLLLLHAPWCGHCKVMMPAYEAAATTLKAEGFLVARLQAEQAGAPFLASIGLRGFPTILGVRDGSTVPYTGARTEAALLEFVRAL